MSFSANSVITKSRAVFGNSLTAEDYMQMCSKTSVSEICSFLRQKVRYGKALSGVEPHTVHRGQLEMLLRGALQDIFLRFHRFDHSKSKVLFDFIMVRQEIDLIITAIEGVSSNSSAEYISALPVFLIKHSKSDLLQLGTAKSFLDIERILSGSPFIKPIRPLLIDAQESGRISINECERRLYTLYYLRCLKKIKDLFPAKEAKELKSLILKSIDMQNVVNCCRMTMFYKMEPDNIKQTLLPFKYRLNDERLERLMSADTIEKVRQELEAAGYRTDDNASFDTVELLTESISLDRLRKTLRMSQNSAVVYFALTECLNIELNNIRTIIEGIRYGLSASEIQPMLVI